MRPIVAGRRDTCTKALYKVGLTQQVIRSVQPGRDVSGGGNYFSSTERRIAFPYTAAAESERLHDIPGKLR